MASLWLLTPKFIVKRSVFIRLFSQTHSLSSSHSKMSWKPPPVIEDLYAATAGNKFSGINRPTAGSREEKALPRGNAPFQLYSLATPNGKKVSIMLEELGIDYDAHFISLGGDQFGSGFVGVNPNSKIPAAVDFDGPDGKEINIFESANIVLYLAEKYKRFIPENPRLRVEMMNWIFWQMAGQGPMTGNFGHFFAYAPSDKIEARNYGVSRYGMEVQRLCDVLEHHLSEPPGREYIIGNEISIADFIIYPWAFTLRSDGYKIPEFPEISCSQFLSFDKYKNLIAWMDRLAVRPALQRGMTVCSGGVGKPWLTLN